MVIINSCVVIGTGVVASTVAHRCSSTGRKVAVIDSRPFGGTCALRGCDPKKVLVEAAEGRVKHRNISRDPRVAVSIIDSSNPYHMVSVRGKVIEQIKGKVAEEHIDKMAKKYLDKEKYPRRRPGEERLLLRIKPQHVVYWKSSGHHHQQ